MRSVVFGAVFSLLVGATAHAQVIDGGGDVPLAEPPAQPELPAISEVDGGIATITLTDAIQRALVNNPQLQTAQDEYQRSEALVRQVRATWLPNLGLNALYTRLDSDRKLGASVLSPENQFGANLTLNVPVFVPKAWQNYSISKQNMLAQQASADDERRLVAVGVARAYLSILAEHRILEANQRAVASATAHRDYARERFKAGVGNRVDVVRAEQTLAADVALVDGTRVTLARLQEQFGQLLAENRPLDVTGEPNLPENPGAQEETQDAVREHRHDLEALKVRSAIADKTVSNQWSDFTPVVSVAFQPFYQNPPTITLPQTGWQATAALTWPIFDGGLRYGQQAERVLLANEAHVSEDAANRQAMSDVRAAIASLEHADASLIEQRNSAKLAHEALDLVNISYRAGASTNIEVIDAEKAALDADTQAAVNEDIARQARLDLLGATGKFP